jgi:hypothetical protein
MYFFIFIVILLLLIAFWEVAIALIVVLGIAYAIHYHTTLKPRIAAEVVANQRDEKFLKEEVDKAIENKTLVSYPSIIKPYHIPHITRAIQHRVIANAKSITHTNGLESLINQATLDTFSEYVESNDVKNYSFVEISRSSNQYIDIGSYIFKFDQDGNIYLLKSTFHLINQHAFYDASLETNVVVIKNDMIKTYNQQGSEMMKTNIVSSLHHQNTGILKTVTSEMLFGTSYTLLKGMKQMQASISTTHSIHDTRQIQLILKDKSDIVFEGIAIFYDVARYVEKDERVALSNHNRDKLDVKSRQIESNKTLAEKLRELKDLLDDNVISEVEFEELKKELLVHK